MRRPLPAAADRRPRSHLHLAAASGVIDIDLPVISLDLEFLHQRLHRLKVGPLHLGGNRPSS